MFEYICLFFNSDNNLYQVLGELRFWTIVMAPRRKSSSSHGQGKRPSNANEPDERRKPQFNLGLFSSQSMYERYKSYFFNRTILLENIDFVQLSQFRFGEYFLKMGWLPIMTVKEPIYLKLIQAFYSNVVVHVGGPITISCSLRGVNIMLNKEKMCEILGVQSDGDRVYESKSWPNIDGFVVGEAI